MTGRADRWIRWTTTNHRMRSAARTDPGNRVLPAHADAGRDARTARLGGRAHPAVGGRDDRGGVHDAASRVKVGQSRRGAALVTAGRWQRCEPGRERGRRAADSHRPAHRSLAVVRADLLLRAAAPPREGPGRPALAAWPEIAQAGNFPRFRENHVTRVPDHARVSPGSAGISAGLRRALSGRAGPARKPSLQSRGLHRRR